MVLAMVVPIGLNEAILRFVPSYIADNKWAELKGIVSRCPLLIAVIGALTAAVGSLIVTLVPDLAASAFAPPLELHPVSVDTTLSRREPRGAA